MKKIHQLGASVLLLLSASMVFAQSQASSGIIEGRVFDAKGSVIPDVTVAIKNQENGFERILRTDKQGRYRAPLLPLGRYEVAVGRPGFANSRRSGIVLELAQTLNIGFTLQPGNTEEAVNLPSPLLDLGRTQPSTLMNKKLVESLPVSGRKFMDLGVMVPGATEFGDRDTGATADFAGVNHFYSNMLVDGTDAFQAWSNLPRGKFLVPFEFSQNAVREFQVQNGNFTAEFGRSAGGLISAVTKSGTNQWHGDGFYYFADSVLNATPRFAATKPDTQQNQFGASLGGPLQQDRLFIFGNYDQLVRDEPMIVNSGTALDGFGATLDSITDAAERQRFIQAGDYIRSLTGDFTRDLDQYNTLFRTDWHISSRQTTNVRWNYQYFDATNVPENEFAVPIVSGSAVNNNGRAKVRNNSLTLQWNFFFSPQFLNEARFQLAVGRERTTPNGTGPQVRIGSQNSGATFGTRQTLPLALNEDRWQWIDNLTWIRGRHELKVGFDINRISDKSNALPFIEGAYQFNSLRDFANGRYATYTQGFGIPEDRTVSPYYCFFVQDNFKVTSNLNLNLGLRYELQDFQTPSLINPRVPQTGEIRDDKNNLAPRFGFAWTPRGGRTVLRGSYGVYHAPLPIQVNSVAKTQNGIFQSSREYLGPADRRGASPGAPQFPGVLPKDPNPQQVLPGSQIVVFSPDFASPYIQQSNLEIEREIVPEFSFSMGWLYTKGTRLRRNDDRNLFPPVLRTVEIRDTARNISGPVSISSFGGPVSRPDPLFGRITEFFFDSNSVYHAFFVQANKRYSHGVELLFNYTLSKLIEAGQAPGNQITCCTSQNPFDAQDERGLARRDQRHRINLAGIWDLPALPDRGLVKHLFSDWQLNGIVRMGGGRPLTPTVTGDAGGDVNGDGNRNDRAPLFGRNSVTGPGYASVDLGLRRSFRVKENQRLSFVIEAYNLFNRANYLRPLTEYFNLTNVPGGSSRLDGPLPAFGRPFDAMRSRELQLAVRYSF